MKKHLLTIGLILSSPFFIFAQVEDKEETEFTIYGFGRTNFVWDNQDLSRNDLFIPANIKIDTPKNPNFFIGAKQTRLGLDVKHTLDGEVLSFKLEGDFHNDAADATGIFRMRHAYAKYKFILVGMTWSNFFDEEVNPVSVDFEGPNSSTLLRTPQIRFSTYKSKNVLSLSFENPIEKITVGGPVTVLSERFPDVIGAYRINGNFGFVKAAALFRELRYESDKARSLLGYGFTLMSSIKAGEKDKLKLQGVIGTGVAQYIQGASGLNYDAIYNGTNELEELQMLGANISYQHFWKDKMHSSLTLGTLSAGDNENLGPNNYKSGYYGSVNLFWDVVKNFTFGCEVLAGERVNVNDADGSALRLQMNATYKFNKIIK
ncbi:MAG TPA: DcaP family trimeric outer membrane transporter [Flavobacterium sp.]